MVKLLEVWEHVDNVYYLCFKTRPSISLAPPVATEEDRAPLYLLTSISLRKGVEMHTDANVPTVKLCFLTFKIFS